MNGNDASTSTVKAPPRAAAAMTAHQHTNGVSNHSAAASHTRSETTAGNTADSRVTEDGSKDEVSERQQRSMLARQAYLDRQQAEARKGGPPESHQIVTTANGAQRRDLSAAAAEIEFGSDSFDDGFSDVLAGYDETSMGDAEAASRALEMEIDEGHRQRHSGDHDDSVDTSSILHSNHNVADDSGVAFADSDQAILIKQEKAQALEMRRSTSPVKQVKMEAAAAPRRAGSVGRFVSPPPPQPAAAAAAAPLAASSRSNPFKNGASLASVSGGYISGANLMRNGTTSLSAASVGAGASRSVGPNPPPRRMASTTLNGINGINGINGGVEGVASGATVAGRAVGEPVNHGYVAGDGPRGVKRPSEPLAEGANGRAVAAPAAGNAAARPA